MVIGLQCYSNSVTLVKLYIFTHTALLHIHLCLKIFSQSFHQNSTPWFDLKKYSQSKNNSVYHTTTIYLEQEATSKRLLSKYLQCSFTSQSKLPGKYFFYIIFVWAIFFFLLCTDDDKQQAHTGGKLLSFHSSSISIENFIHPSMFYVKWSSTCERARNILCIVSINTHKECVYERL